MLKTLALLIFLVLLGGLACGDDDDEADPTQPQSGTPAVSATDEPSPTASQVPTPSPEPFSGDREPVERPAPDVPPVAIHNAVRFAEHEDFDRIVFEFADVIPGYRIEYVDPPILADGSGLEVEIDGAAFLQVRFIGADAHDSGGSPTIDERELMAGLTSLVEAEITGDFEAQVTWVLGLAAERDFRVSILTAPSRVVVDIGHQE